MAPCVEQVIDLELSTGIPMLYIFRDGHFSRRGSPVGPDATGVYALTHVRCSLSLAFNCFFIVFNFGSASFSADCWVEAFVNALFGRTQDLAAYREQLDRMTH